MTEENAASEMAEDMAARLAAMEQRLVEVEAEARARVVRAELKAEALRAGMIDLDGLKLVEADAVALSDAGEANVAEALIRDLRRKKPWLFGASNSSSTAAAPPAQPPRPKLATEMTEAEWRAARADLLRRR
jgi:hypothetical protein